MTAIGPPHLGQGQRGVIAGWGEVFGWIGIERWQCCEASAVGKEAEVADTSNTFKELRQGDFKAPRKSFDIPKGYVSDSALNSAVVGSMQPGSFRCLFLVNPLLSSYPAYGAAEPDTDIN